MQYKWQPMIPNGCAEPARGPVQPDLRQEKRVWQKETVGALSDAS